MEKTPAFSLRLSPEAKRLLQKLGEQLGLTMTAVIETAIREKARRDGVK